MVIDSSALLSIGFEEPEQDRLVLAIAQTARRLISPVNWTESMIVAESRKGREAAERLRLLADTLSIRMAPFSEDTAWEAHQAWRFFGKGRHPAALNMGDCWAYATARMTGEPLLFKGDDFARTDVKSVAW